MFREAQRLACRRNVGGSVRHPALPAAEVARHGRTGSVRPGGSERPMVRNKTNATGPEKRRTSLRERSYKRNGADVLAEEQSQCSGGVAQVAAVDAGTAPSGMLDSERLGRAKSKSRRLGELG